jgi:hypothetical protein
MKHLNSLQKASSQHTLHRAFSNQSHMNFPQQIEEFKVGYFFNVKRNRLGKVERMKSGKEACRCSRVGERREGRPAGEREIGALVGGDVLVEGEGVADEVEEEVPGEEDGGAALVELELELAGAGGGGGLSELVPLHSGGGGGGGHVAALVTPDDIEDPAADMREMRERKGESNQIRPLRCKKAQPMADSEEWKGGEQNLESVARLASHELEGAVEKGARVAEGGGAVIHHDSVQEHGWRHGAARWRSPARRWRSRPVPFVSPSPSLSALRIDRRKKRLIGLSPVYLPGAGYEYDTAPRFQLIRAQYSAHVSRAFGSSVFLKLRFSDNKN